MPDLTPTTPVASRVIAWQQAHGRHHLPWQNTRDPYRIWLSEIMLQQTQVSTVLGYYTRFLQHFPTVGHLAAAPAEAVMGLWAGLGYYTRARNLHRCAQAVMSQHQGHFPDTAEALASLPGIGRSTAAAIAAFAYGERAAILDGNVRRVFARHHGIEGDPGSTAVQRLLWQVAESLLPDPSTANLGEAMVAYTQGLMDLGATVCTRGMPDCGRCPLRDTCVALREARQLELPGKRPRKIVPERRANLLWVQHGTYTLLERRPPQGIWGGLLSLPECPDEDLLARCRELGVQPDGEPQALPTFTHVFTHFRLQATPWRLHVHSPALADDNRHVWVSPEDLTQAALPAPIRKLLLPNQARLL